MRHGSGNHQDGEAAGPGRRAAAAVSAGWRRVRADASYLMQRSLAATAAWVIAKRVFDHHVPFFAPIAAVVALNTSLGERGSNALRLLLGVGVGIMVGESTVALFGSGYGSLALSSFVAMTIARAFGGLRLTITQAAAGAILTVTSAGGEAGPDRLFDALIGTGVALLFSQFLFSPEPVALLRRAMSAALADMSNGLELAARALERDDAETNERAVNNLRDLRDPLVEVARLRRASSRVARHSLIWWTHTTEVLREIQSADHLDLLGSSCLMLTRTAVAVKGPQRRTLAPSLHELANLLDDLAKEPDDSQTLQTAAGRALEIRRRLGKSTPAQPAVAAVQIAAQLVTADIMEFAGIHPDGAADATQEKRDN